MELMTDEVALITGVPEGTLRSLLTSGGISPAIRGHQGRDPHRWTIQQALGIAVARGLRMRAVESDDALAAYRYLSAFSEDEIEAEFQAGRTCLMIVGVKCLSKLLSLESILACPEIDYRAAATVGLMPTALHVGRVWAVIKREAARFTPAPPAPPLKRPAPAIPGKGKQKRATRKRRAKS